MSTEIIVVAVILIALGIAVGVWYFWRERVDRSHDWRSGTDSRVGALLRGTHQLTTPGGIPLYFEPNQDVASFPKDAPDAGWEAVLARAACEYPVNASNHKPKVCVLGDGQLDSQGDPCFKVYINMHSPYYNSEWDQRAGQGHNVDHYVLAAGQITRIGEPFGDVIAIPFHNREQASHCQTICDFEWEHALLAWYDGEKFERTKIHGGGQGHPLIEGACVPKPTFLVGKVRVGKCDGNLILTK